MFQSSPRSSRILGPRKHPFCKLTKIKDKIDPQIKLQISLNSYLKSLICISYMLISEKECIVGFLFARLSHPSGFNLTESRLSRKLRLPSDESLLKYRKKRG